MAEPEVQEGGDDETVAGRKAGHGRALRRWALRGVLALAALIILAFAVLNSPTGKRFIADQIAAVAPASGLRFEVGRIEGDIFSAATLYDVSVLDPKGVFLTVPVVELDWRPFSWLTSGLDVRTFVIRGGNLSRLPELLPGDPDAPILPDFDIQIGRLAVEKLTIARGIAGDDAQTVNMQAEADIRSGRVYIKTDAQIGKRDTFFALIEAQPDQDIFDLAVNYQAPRGGAISTMIGSDAGYSAQAQGDGSWSAWDGAIVVRRADQRLAAFTLKNRAGQYALLGQANPGAVVQGLTADALGETVSVAANGTLKESTLAGRLYIIGRAISAQSNGSVDLADNRFDDFGVTARLRDPALFGDAVALNQATLDATLDGRFRDLTIAHILSVGALESGTTSVSKIVQESTARFDGTRFTVPLNASVERVLTGNRLIDPKLVGGTVRGTLIYAADRLLSDDLTVAFPSANARLALRGNVPAGAFALVGPVAANGLPIDGVGDLSGTARIDFRIGQNYPWTLAADFDARVPRVTNDTIVNLAGPALKLRGGVALGSVAPLDFRNVTLASNKLSLSLNGTVRPDTTVIAGRGLQQDYGAFTIEAALNKAGPTAVLVFASPLPAAGLEDVRVAIAPTAEGFAIDTNGQSLLGAFNGQLTFIAPAQGPSQIDIKQLNIWKTAVTGQLTLGDGGADGRLVLRGGGLDGRIGLAARDGGQEFSADIEANNARFGGQTALALARANIEARGFLKDGSSTIDGSMQGQGLSYGSVFIGQVAAQAQLNNGRGTATASIAGRRGSQFNLQLNANFVPDRIAVAGRGDFAGKTIRMPRRAVFTAQKDGGWRLAKTQLSYGGGGMNISGTLGGDTVQAELQLDKMPLSLADIAISDIGLGGTISGLVDFQSAGRGAPTGSARVKIDNLTRSGLVLTSQPMDIALVAQLTANRLEARTVIDEGGQRRGRLQARISGLPAGGTLIRRLEAGDLFAQLRFDGPAAAVWRLSGVEGFDLTGPLKAAANVTGSLADPAVRGSISSDNLRLQSSLSGTDVQKVRVRGTFSGSQLKLSQFAGVTTGGGNVSGSGTIGFLDLATRGPQIDLRIAAKNANLLDTAGLDATVTGPLRIVSNGLGGTVAGRLQVNRASWKLGTAAAAEQLPQIRTREINAPADIAPARGSAQSWRYLIDAKAGSRITVDGLGLQSEWGADIRLRGTTSEPRIGGRAQMVRGFYTFAGTRFELTRGRIDFDQDQPIDPRLDIRAETETSNIDVTVSVQGNALQPEITFTSEPLLPEEEILAQLLFGGSVTNLSTTDALQLGAALASLRGGGGGLDPINQLRSAIGLDRLRIVNADPALGRQTGVALGKNIGRKFYIEVITDGRGYSATEAEYRVTSWLSLLGSISTIGRESLVAEVSRDY